MHERCAGIDISKADVKVCIRVPATGKHRRRRTEVRTFTAMTNDLLAMRDWLVCEGVTQVAMEATGSYWKPIFYLLEQSVECWLLNARHMKAVPGRKTDVKDAEWIAKLTTSSSVRGRFLPDLRMMRPPGVPRGLWFAGACMNVDQRSSSDEMMEAQRRIAALVSRTVYAIANHDFEGARACSREEAKERENLFRLRNKYKIEE